MDAVARAFVRLGRMRARMRRPDDAVGFMDVFRPLSPGPAGRPKGMHRRTYSRLVAENRRAQTEAFGLVLRQMGEGVQRG